ncbi:DUF948 domain-containing protein [Nitrospirota bacterium]
MNLETLAIVISILLALGLGFLIPVLIELKRTIAKANEFMEVTEKDLSSSLREIEDTLKSIRGITDKVNEVTGDVTSFSDGLRGAAHDIKETTRHIEKLTLRLSRHFSGVKAAISAVLGVIINNLKR